MQDVALLEQPDQLENLATLDCDAAFRPFDPEDLNRLRRYQDVCELLSERAFLRERVSFSFRAAVDEPGYERLEHAGEDALRSLVLDFRQLWMDKEITHFPGVRNRLRMNAASLKTDAANTAVQELDRLGRRYSEARKRSMMRYVDAENPMKVMAHVTAARVVNDWLYGGVVHYDPDAAKRVNAWSPTSYEWTLIKAIHGFVKVYFELAVLVERILDGEPAR